MRNYANSYSDKHANYVIEHKKYKKSTIAFLEMNLQLHTKEAVATAPFIYMHFLYLYQHFFSSFSCSV